MKRDWKKERAEAVKHARLTRRRPELREQLYASGARNSGDLYGTGPQPPDQKAETRETAQQKETP